MNHTSSIFDLPLCILTDILARLPVKSILRCRYVCKAWNRLLCLPEFANLHLSMSQPIVVVSHFAELSAQHTIKLFEIEDGADRHSFWHDPIMTFKIKDRMLGLNNRYVHLDLVGSVNGLLCFYDFKTKHKIFYVCNPITREYIVLPKPQSLDSIDVYGFGFSAKTEQYKVVRLYQDEFLDGKTRRTLCISKIEVYTIGTRIWRSIGQLPGSVFLRTYTSTLHGNLHWLVSNAETALICFFDVEEESIDLFPCPQNTDSSMVMVESLGVLGGRLCVCENTSENGKVFWVMKEYKDCKSWTKEYVIDSRNIAEWGLYEVIHPLRVMKNGEMLFLFWEDRLFSYKPKSKVLQEVPFLERYFNVVFGVASFISLKKFSAESVCLL